MPGSQKGGSGRSKALFAFYADRFSLTVSQPSQLDIKKSGEGLPGSQKGGSGRSKALFAFYADRFSLTVSQPSQLDIKKSEEARPASKAGWFPSKGRTF